LRVEGRQEKRIRLQATDIRATQGRIGLTTDGQRQVIESPRRGRCRRGREPLPKDGQVIGPPEESGDATGKRPRRDRAAQILPSHACCGRICAAIPFDGSTARKWTGSHPLPMPDSHGFLDQAASRSRRDEKRFDRNKTNGRHPS
jgi:hypothetical protein